MAHGFWESAWSADRAASAASEIGELKAGHGGVWWTRFDPADSRTTLIFYRGGKSLELTPAGFSLRSRVYEYGGGAFCLTDSGFAFVNEADQHLYLQALDGLPRVLTVGQRRYGGLHFDARRQLILAVEEEQGAEVVHRLVGIDLHGERRVLVEGADFYAGVATADDRLAWIEWSRPHQPWTETRLCVADWTEAVPGTARIVAGADGGESLQQPSFDSHGRLCVLSDRAGWWQPWQAQGAELMQPPGVPLACADHAPAPWQLGACTSLALGDSWLLSRFEEGFGVLLEAGSGGERHLSPGYTRFRQLAADEQFFYAIAAAPDCTSAVIAIERCSGAVEVLGGGEQPLASEEVSRPEAITFASGEGQAHAFFYPPSNTAYEVDPAVRPPLVVFVHGGPTSACYPVFDPRIQFWTQRGFAVADLNYRGSSGFGRAGRMHLRHAWGEVDVADACELVRVLGEQGRIEPAQAFIRGGSAGGYTALCALAFQRVFRAGASLYGVSDPLALGKITHKFESDYLDWLIGDPQADALRYQARTPLLHAHRITVPVIFFQGGLDAVVPPAQTESMVEALHARGVEVEYHLFADERHGFRQARHLAQVMEAELAFYQRQLGNH
ncbi:alpha/beta hydrolase family protein [Pseudomonas sp. LRF_L74]|uniref:alpha/beta hydrolase family protein n=1 Tax=Pseudomonas sp. LRF_L74 TaxID=3369422 RepID=UPI003F604EEF